MRRVMRRRLLLAAAVAATAAVGAPAHAATLGNWDKREQRAVARAGVLAPLQGGFHGERALTPGQMLHALEAIAARPARVPRTRVTVALFHRLVVKQLGLGDVATSVQHEAA